MLRDQRTRGGIVPDDTKDVDWDTFKARQAQFSKGNEEAPPDPERAEATAALIDALPLFG